ncbi:MAG: YwmB family TATA-box binding protein [Acidibacillus sp.]|nr:YwmB family TATA-box binding protein [Acidibacillus sp.]
MKKLVLLGLAIATVMSYFAGQTFAEVLHGPVSNDTPQFVERAFNATHAQMTGFEVHDWTTLHNAFVPVKTLVAEAKAYAHELGLHDMHLYEHQDPNDHVAQWSGTVSFGPHAKDVTTSVEMASMLLPDAPAQTVLILRYLGTTSDEQAFASAYARLTETAQQAGGLPKINGTLFGNVPGLQGESERATRIAKAYQAVFAKELQSMVYPYTTSIAGYGAAPVPYLVAGKQLVNIQVAMHEDSFEHNTKVLVGSPIITLEY